MFKNTHVSVVALMLLLCFTASSSRAASRLSKAEVEQRLDYLVASRSFSRSQPLSQTRLMELVLDLSRSGKFPQRYKGGTGSGVKGCDDYITRSNVRRFTRELLGQDLRMWNLLGEKFMPIMEGEKFMPIMEGEKLGWWFNTGNTMYERPKVILTSRKSTSRLINAQFRIFHRQGNTSNNTPATLVATGSARLQRIGRDWVVTSWQVNRNKNWRYASGWGG
jgi:hypothetical protein